MIKQAAMAIALALAFAGPALAAGEAHQHAHGGEAKLALNQGKKWPTDAPLRQGMENIRAALGSGMKYGALATKVKGETRREGAEKIARALQAYGEHFDHAGWQRL